jgi:hypothetical protein
MCIDLKEGVFVHAFITEQIAKRDPSEATVDNTNNNGQSNNNGNN